MENLENKEIVDETKVEEAIEEKVEVVEEEAVEEIAEETTDEVEVSEESEETSEAPLEEMDHSKKKKMNASKDKDMEDENNEDDADDDEEVVEKKKKMNASYKVKAEDVDVKEDVDAMLQGQDLSEEFQNQVTTIFEAAVVSKVNEKLEEIYADYETELQENVAEIRQELSEKVDEYLSYVAKEYVAENKLAVENKLKLEIMENFMSGLKKVFEENYVDVPEEKVDLYGEALETLEEKEQKLNEQFEKNIKLSKKLEDLEKEIILKDVTEGLTVSQAEKVRSLSESLEFTTKEDMMEKVTLIKDNYFPSETIVESAVLDESALETSVEDSPVVQEENKFQSVMDVYARALNRPKD
jgi:hypothetical protein